MAESEVGQPPYRFATLFGNDAGLTQPEVWLRALHARKTHPEHTDADERRFELATDALEKVLPGARFDKITIDGEVLFCVDGSKVPLDRLTDGYRSTTAWTLDLVRRLCDAFPDRDDPLSAHGVVLVDEIDLHLHPRWQRTVIETVRQTFPNLQFIVTTHSPFVAQDMKEGDKLIVLKRGDGGAVVAEHGMGFAHRWRADQILTSWLFGLETTRGEDAQQDERDYQRLLQDQASNRLTDAQKGTLHELKQRLDKDPLGETLEDQQLLDAADALIAALHHKR